MFQQPKSNSSSQYDDNVDDASSQAQNSTNFQTDSEPQTTNLNNPWYFSAPSKPQRPPCISSPSLMSNDSAPPGAYQHGVNQYVSPRDLHKIKRSVTVSEVPSSHPRLSQALKDDLFKPDPAAIISQQQHLSNLQPSVITQTQTALNNFEPPSQEVLTVVNPSSSSSKSVPLFGNWKIDDNLLQVPNSFDRRVALGQPLNSTVSPVVLGVTTSASSYPPEYTNSNSSNLGVHETFSPSLPASDSHQQQCPSYFSTKTIEQQPIENNQAQPDTNSTNTTSKPDVATVGETSHITNKPYSATSSTAELNSSLKHPAYRGNQPLKRLSVPESMRHQRNFQNDTEGFLLPKYGAMGPSLNYILGLDEYRDTTRTKTQKSLLNQQLRSYPVSTVVSSPPDNNDASVVGLTNSAIEKKVYERLSSRSAPTSNRLLTVGNSVVSPVKEAKNSSPCPTGSAVDFRKLLQSFPPTFPLVPYSNNSGVCDKIDVEGSGISKERMLATEPKFSDEFVRHNEQLQQQEPGNSSIPVATFHKQSSDNKLLLSNLNELHDGSEATSAKLSPVRLRHGSQNVFDNRGDEFLWKLFLPQPSVPTVSKPSKFDNVTGQGFSSVKKLKLHRQKTLEAALTSQERVSNLTSVSTPVSLPSEVKPPERLLVVVRRLPDRVCATVRQNNSPIQQSLSPQKEPCPASSLATTFLTQKLNTPELSGGLAYSSLDNCQQSRGVILDTCTPPYLDIDDTNMQSLNLTMQDVDNVIWQIDRNEFGVDFAEAFPKSMQRIVVADPGIHFSKLSCNPAVQQRLRHSLRNYLREKDIIPVFIDEYKGARNEKYSEEILAPLFHYRIPPVSTGFHFIDWEGYQELNNAFLHTLVVNYKPRDWILVFNYQLMLLPKLLRDNPVTHSANIAFYLATVFPSSEMYRILPQREELLRGILAATFIGFHGFQYKRHFLTACTRVLGIECSGDRIEPHTDVGGCAGARVVTFPRGINSQPWLHKLQKPAIQARIAELREKFKGRKVLMGIDTLDYTKGIPNKMLAFNKFLTDNPEWADKVVFFQICVPKGHGYQEATGFYQNERISRVDRKEILAHLYQLVGAINASFGNIVKQPVQFLLSSLNVEQLVCLYALADILIITPLRESHSWAAHEFILCQSYTNKGVLILSEFSGSSQSLGAASICVNPWDPHALAAAIHDALVMKDEEKIARHEYALNYVLTYNSESWGHHLMQEFRQAAAEIEAERRTIPQKLSVFCLVQTQQLALTTVLILGLRGALVPSNSRGVDPQLAGRARLPKRVEMALHILANDPNTHILIISSSTIAVLLQAVSHFPSITIMAENGHFVRPARISTVTQNFITKQAGGEVANVTESEVANAAENTLTFRKNSEEDFILSTGTQVDLSWMEPVEEICRYFEERTPGSFLYRTGTSVAWNYRGAQRDHGAIQARDLLIHLWAGPTTLTAPTDVVVGPHSVEVRSSATNKSAAVEKWLRELEEKRMVDLSKAMVVCAANFLPRDEDVYGAIDRVVESTALHPTHDNQSSLGPENSTSSCVYPNVTEIYNTTDEIRKALSDGAFAIDEPSLLASDRVFTCTVGLKPSRAEYYISDEKELERVLTILAALAALKLWDIEEEEETILLTRKLMDSRDTETDHKHSSQHSPYRFRLSGKKKQAVATSAQPVQWITTPTSAVIQASESNRPKRQVDIAAILASPDLQRGIVAAVCYCQTAHGGDSFDALIQNPNNTALNIHKAPVNAMNRQVFTKPFIYHRKMLDQMQSEVQPLQIQRRRSTPARLLLHMPIDSTLYTKIDDIKSQNVDSSEDQSVDAAADDEGSIEDDEFEDDDDLVEQCDDGSSSETTIRDSTSTFSIDTCNQHNIETPQAFYSGG